VDDDAKKLADDLAVLRTMAATPTLPPSKLTDQLDAVESQARTLALAKAGASRGWFGRIVGFDPATVYLILQAVLLLIEVIRQLRDLRRPSA
jgi:hypothetical protein